MHKLMILIEPLPDQDKFESSWPAFLKLVESLPGLRREATSNVEHLLFGSFPYTLVHELFFDTMEATQAALASDSGRQAGKILQEITQGKVALCFADHKEDNPENIIKYREQSQDDRKNTHSN
jgi:uncharacterized protein (TIGR02118 family)